MAIQIPDNKWFFFDAANFLDAVTQFSFVLWARIDTVTATAKQYVVSHRGATNQFSIRKYETNDKWRFSVTAGGVNQVCDDSGAAVVAGTVYHLGCTWKKNNASGMKLYINGALITTVSTTSQTADYDSGGNSDIVFGAKTTTQDSGKCSLEGFAVWPGTELTAAQILSLSKGVWPHQIALPRPGLQYPCWGNQVATVQDLSGNGRHVTDPTWINGITTSGRIGRWEDPGHGLDGYHRVAASAGPPANPWVAVPQVFHPTVTKVIGSLTNDTQYEFKLVAVDTSGNVSVDSAIVVGTPTGTTVKHTPRKRLRG